MIKIALIIGCIILAATGNLLLKWGMSECGSIIKADIGVVHYYGQVFTKWQVQVGGLVYVVSALMWMAVLGMMDISAAYPIFVAGAFTIVTAAAIVLFHEHVNAIRIIGIMVVMLGILIVSQSTRWGQDRGLQAPRELRAKIQDNEHRDGIEQDIHHQRSVGK